MGGVKSSKYFNRCTDFIHRFRLRNVKLIQNASWNDIADVLKRAKVFLHTRRGEHFGISTVEAMGYGCLPIVHDSGGARETVPIDELRFQSSMEAVRKIQGLLVEYSVRKRRYSKLLRKNAKQFGASAFHRQMQDLIFGKFHRKDACST
jgi:glycosyltransferase involved in cell wall biosynthesis